MKITRVETIVINMPMLIEGSVVPKQGGRARTSMDTLLVRVDTDQGVTGWGEGFGHRIFTATRAALDSFRSRGPRARAVAGRHPHRGGRERDAARVQGLAGS